MTDLTGAARPSIADPFLPRKVEEGRIEDIRESIGCNVCYAGDTMGVVIRCTQNPTMVEEWRKGWHPEEKKAKRSDASVLVIGAGPAGLEATRALGKRGYTVTLADAGTALGGRLPREAALPGMSEYIRVRDDRAQQFHKMTNVAVYLESPLNAKDVLELAHALTIFDGKAATLACQFTGAVKEIVVTSVVMVTPRAPRDELYHDILATVQGEKDKLPFTLTRIGDCEAPAIVAAATYAGHRYARNLEEQIDIDQPLRHDRVDVGADAARMALPVVSQTYLKSLLQHYEEEIEGKAYFAGIPDRFLSRGQKEKLMLLSEVETYTVAAMQSLAEKYGLTPRSTSELHANGHAQAADAPGDWNMLIAEMQKTFSQYITDYERLEAMAPTEDLPGLRVVEAHKVAAVDFLNREAGNDPGSSAPLQQFLKTGTA